MFPDLRQKVLDLFPALLNGFVRGRQLAFDRKKKDQPAQQKGHTADYHRNANRIHFECSKGHRRAVSKGRTGQIAPDPTASLDGQLKQSSKSPRAGRQLYEDQEPRYRFSDCWRFGVPNPITCPRPLPSIRILGFARKELKRTAIQAKWPESSEDFDFLAIGALRASRPLSVIR
jgi:hypothetical protein